MRPARPVLRSIVLACFTFSFTSGAFAQSSNGTLHGTITDQGGGVLPGATVKLQSPSTGLSRDVITNHAGVYVFNFLPAGEYDITAELSGFKTARQAGLRLEIGQSLVVDLKMEVGRIEEVVEVTASAPLLDKTSASIGTVIQASQLRELPLAGRHWSGLMLLAPGAINTGEGTHLSTRFVGRARDDNNWTFDGIDATGVKDPRQDSDARLIISSESIAEFRVSSTLYSAESGTAAGGVVQLVSKTGTNKMHGTAFDFIRNERFDARPFGTVGEMPPFNLNQFGVNAGGPIVSQRTFFFVNYEGIRQRQTRSFVRAVPSAAFKAGVTSALAPIIALYPAGTNPTTNPDIDDWRGTEEVTNDENAALFRVDHRFSDKATLFARYNFDIADLVNPADTGVTTNNLRPVNFTTQFQRIFGGNFVSEFKFGYNQSNRHVSEVGPSKFDVSVSGFTVLTGPQETVEDGHTLSGLADFALVRGRNNIKFGGEIRRIYIDVGEDNTTGLTYSNRPNFQQNRLDSFGIVDFPVVQGQRWWYVGYLQDDIKWTSNLTLNAGLRYEFYSVPVEKDTRDKVWRINCGGFCAKGTRWYDPDYNNFGPRLGFAWTPARFNDNTVVRGGFGVFFGPGQNDDVFAPIDNAGARTTLTRNEAATLAYPIEPFLALAGSVGNAARAIDEHRVDQYAEHYSLTIQQALPWKMTMQVGYLGNQGHHMLDRSNVNNIDPATGTRPLPQFAKVDIKSSGSNTAFHGLQVSLYRRASRGLQLGTQYMWSHAFDEGALGGGESTSIQNAACRRCEHASTNQDVRHTLTMNGVYALPFGRDAGKGDGAAKYLLGGWQLSGLLQARTGRPLTITSSRSAGDLPDGNNSAQRADLVAGQPLYPSTQTPEQWFNTAAFALPARGTWGSAGRNIIRAPGLFQVDLALQKRFALTTDRSLEFRAEAFNAFNRVNLGAPGISQTSPSSFGRITGPLNRTYGTGTARQIQFMFRFNF
jgi:carboxypeptidase family protein/TonB-dependent receptor-like protein